MLLSLIFFLTFSSSVYSFTVEALHNQMTDSELAYYFQDYNKIQEPKYEIVYLPTLLKEDILNGIDDEEEEDEESIQFDFSAFEQPVKLRLKRNKNLLAPGFRTLIRNGDEEVQILPNTKDCHYLHKDENKNTIAAISICQPRSVQGIIIQNNETLEIHPLTDRLQRLMKLREPLLDSADEYEDKTPHLVKRASRIPGSVDDIFPTAGNVWDTNELIQKDESEEIIFDFNEKEAASNRPVGGLTLELAMFFDEAAYKIFAPFMNYDNNRMQDMLLAYLNGVQALYHQPSLGTTLELVLVRLDIMTRQPSQMYHHNGERSKLLDSFCEYQESINVESDTDPNHWDMALYISGLDFYAIENGKKSGATMGLATVGGVCHNKYACIIAELGTTNAFGKPYPSAGFTSVYILAHEIGHNLGMHHDSVGNECAKEGYIMSPSRGTNGETQWSSCSAKIMSKLSWAKCLRDSGKMPKHLDHSKFLDHPGQKYTAKQQCEILLRDKDAVVSPSQQLSTICYNLQCKTPHRSGYYFAGPALDGTQCDMGKICFGGECLSKSLPKPTKVVPGGWGPWKEASCKSGCIEKSRGYTTKRRICNNPPPVNTDLGCEGSSVEFATCKDEKICKRRVSVVNYASQKCEEFSKVLPELDAKGGGLQAPHEEGRVWMGCAIFCKKAGSGTFYTPRIELNDLGVSPYFPDGTWCHKQNNMNYYCMHHHCLPENFVFTKSSTMIFDLGDDVPFSQNAHPDDIVPPEIKSYLSLDSKGKPLLTNLGPTKLKNRDWETDDYIEIPELTHKFREGISRGFMK